MRLWEAGRMSAAPVSTASCRATAAPGSARHVVAGAVNPGGSARQDLRGASELGDRLPFGARVWGATDPGAEDDFPHGRQSVMDAVVAGTSAQVASASTTGRWISGG